MEMRDFLMKSAETCGIRMDSRMLNCFSIYYELLIEKNKYMNLSAINDMEGIVLKHFIDSMSLSHYYDLKNQSIIDVGTGAGFPGLPLAILYSDAEFLLIDSIKKRLLFVDSVLEKCGMNNVTLLHGRSEDFGRDVNYREKFDFCLSRAVANLPTLLEYCIPFVKVGGRFIAYKSEQFSEEFDRSENAMAELNCDLEDAIVYSIPNTDFYRVYASFIKRGKLDMKYPRRLGKPKKYPL